MTCDDVLVARRKNEAENTPMLVESRSLPTGTPHATYKVEALEHPYGVMKEKRVRSEVEDSHVISSEVTFTPYSDSGLTGKHTVLVDLDLPARLVESSTKGHSHLYIDKELSWREYKRLLHALMKAGIIEKGYYGVSVKRKATHLRLPWVKKTVTEKLSSSGY